jgi:hypothetical protein
MGRACDDDGAAASGDDADRQLRELTGELRVSTPGVTVLVAFLLTVPFARGFTFGSAFDRATCLVAFLTVTAALVLLMGESAYHRLRGHPYDKALLVRTATRQAIAALVLLAVSLTAVVLLVTNALYGRSLSLVVAASLLLLAAVTWFGLPLHRRRTGR